MNWPEVTEAVLKAVSIFELNFVQLGSTDCVLRLSYFEKLAVVTIFPFVLAIILPLMYYGMLWIRRRCFSASIDYALERRRVIYGLLLLFYVALPGCASYTFRYFSCLRFERGVGRPDLKALAIDLTIKCGSPAYHRWFPFVVLMILIWPVGCPLVVGLILWSRRHRLDPPLVAADMPRSIGANIPSAILEDNDEELIVEFYRAQRHFKTVVRQLAKIEKRNQDVPLKAIEFLYEEYEPRTFLFPVFEAVRRIFLTGVLAMFYPGSMSQVTVGLFGSMISYRVFSYFQPYIDDDDDIVSEVAQTQLVILFFAAMIVFVSENADSKDGIMQSQAFGIVLLLVFSASFLVAVYFVLVNVFGHEEVRRVASKTLRLRSRRSSTTDLLEEEEEEEDAKVDAANAAARKTTTSQPSFLSVVSKERSTTAFSDLIRDDDDDQDEINEDDDQDKEDDDEMKC